MKSDYGLTNSRARELFARTTRSTDRVLVTGATGWFGQTAIDLIAQNKRDSMYLASRTRTLPVGQALVSVSSFDIDEIAHFEPTVVIDCAFLTRDRVPTMPLEEYVRTNEKLTGQLIEIASLPSVERVVSISSGAAIYPHDALDDDVEDNPYGWTKRRSERRLAESVLVDSTSVVIARAWSVSGAYVLKPRSYAFSDMIIQAMGGSVHVTAATRVYRRYVSVEDLLTVALASATSPGLTVIDSGGPLVEMQELAEAVIRIVNPSATITRVAPVPGEPGAYYADPQGWDLACAAAKFDPATLDEQIAITRAGLGSRLE
jgi:nucleoside-diphosphate-sugar epimerase